MTVPETIRQIISSVRGMDRNSRMDFYREISAFCNTRIENEINLWLSGERVTQEANDHQESQPLLL